MMIIHLTGYLRDLVPNPDIKVEANSVAEAVTALQQFEAFNPRKSSKKHFVEIEGFSSHDAIFDKTDVTEITLKPVMIGSKQGGLGQIIMGIIIIVAAIFIGPGSFAAMGLSQGSVIMAGAMMVLGGVLQMLAPQPKMPGMGSVGADERSKYLGANQNTVAIGTHIPMVIGRRKWAGHYVSFDVDAGTMNQAPASWYSSTFTDYGELTHSAAPEALPMPEPWEYDQQPESIFSNVTTVETVVRLNFSPAVQLDSGQYDVTFSNGLTLSVINDADAGLVSSVVLPAGEPDNLPSNGTPIVFTRNYV